MRYVSTRGAAPALDFRDVTLAGLANDGGLYLPEAWPSLTRDEIAALAGLSYVETAVARDAAVRRRRADARTSCARCARRPMAASRTTR